ncbi:MAG: sulfatase-like hydrolase/transferase, partial [Thermoguttaceae bacterium]
MSSNSWRADGVSAGTALCIAWLLAAAPAWSAEQTVSAAPVRPNLILILCDNLGYGDVGCFNPEARQRTPRIDRMAAEGTKFTDCYAAATVCTPSRAALMTGCYPRRVGLDWTEPDGLVLRPVSHNGLNPSEITVAELLKSRGYATAC